MPWVSKKWIERVESRLSKSYWNAHQANVRCNDYESKLESLKKDIQELRENQQRTSQWVRDLKRGLIKDALEGEK